MTGGASGIGESIAHLLSAEGGRVLIADSNEINGQRVANEIRSAGGNAEFHYTDVSNGESVTQMVSSCIGETGTVTVLVNAAGRQVPTELIAELEEDEWSKVMDVNAKGVFLCTKAVLPHMVEAGDGRIINLGSASVLEGATFSAPYSVSKAAVEMLTKVTSSQYRRKGIRANCVLPGLIDTPGSQQVEGILGTFDEFVSTIPAGRAGLPADVAQLVLFLASDESYFISGSSFVIDGGRNSR